MTELQTNISGKTVLITGASDGIGKATALQLATMGASVIGIGRNPDKIAATLAALNATPGVGEVTMLRADLSSMQEVRTLAATIKHHHPRIDVLINNAGGFFPTRHTTADGYEMTFALDHLAPFLLTNLLLDTLVASRARVITLSSAMHMLGRINFDDLHYAHRRYSGIFAYSQAKLANILFATELARRTAGSGVTSNLVHPGLVRSSIGSAERSLTTIGLAWAMRLRGISPEEGAATSVYLASSPEVAQITGGYFVRCKQIAPIQHALDQSIAGRLWRVSAEMVDLPRDLVENAA